jgi:hypothetical protein
VNIFSTGPFGRILKLLARLVWQYLPGAEPIELAQQIYEITAAGLDALRRVRLFSLLESTYSHEASL